jgi:hypothetical protein
LPESLISRAYEFSSELAWRPQDLSALAEVLRIKKIPVLGGEVWIKSSDGPMIPSDVHHWSVEKKESESEDDFADRSVEEMVKFGEGLASEFKLKEDWSSVYVNLAI